MCESSNIEYKREFPVTNNGKYNHSIIAKEFVSFLNSEEGGTVYFGIEDDGSVCGINDTDAVQIAISETLRDHIQENALGLFDIKLLEIEDKKIIKVTLSSGPSKPYYIKKERMTTKGCYIRVGTQCIQMSKEMIKSCF